MKTPPVMLQTVLDPLGVYRIEGEHGIRDQWGTHGMERIGMAFWEVMLGLRAPLTAEMTVSGGWVFRPWWEAL